MAGKKATWTKKSLAQKRLDALFQEGKINKDDRPATIWEMDAEFQKFSKDVFRTHFNKTKSRFGVECKKFSSLFKSVSYILVLVDPQAGKKRDADVFDEDDSDDDVAAPAVGSGSTPLTPIRSPSKKAKKENRIFSDPVLTAVYTDPETENERVIVVASLPSGCSGLNFTLSEDGETAIISYTWPFAMYNTEYMFEKWLVTRQLENYHPKIVAILRELEKVRDTIESAPEGSIRVPLPIPVQTDTRTFKKNGLQKKDGSVIFIAELQAHQKSYAITAEDTT
ncbi:hypothetical protein HK098_006074, partial [Nowakowskiella sp. JEL0407]